MSNLLRGRSLVGAVLLLSSGIAASAQQLHAELVVDGLAHPVAFVQDPSQANVQFVVEQGGRIRPVVGGHLAPEDFLDLSDVVSTNSDGGLLGLAFPPDYGSSGRFYVNFMDANDNTVIARFVRMAGDPLRADPASRFDFVWPDGESIIAEPYCCHDGGHLAFGPDGDLYIGLGDGGAWDDPDHRAQNPQSLLGKMLRLDVSVPEDDPAGYRVPPDNPFVGQDGVLGEIWDAGLRNPWRYTFDDPARGGTGALIIGDVGQDTWEEFDYEPAGRGGRNFGWRNREGAHDHITTLPPWFAPLTDPTYEYPHDGSPAAIIGGYVYRGAALGADFAGRYFFGDFMTGRLWSAQLDLDPVSGEASVAGVREHTADVFPPAIDYFDAFGQDANGELYVVSWFHGTIYRLAPGPGDPPTASDLRASVDTPVGGPVEQPFMVAGWALDLGAAGDTGIASVQISAVPTGGVAIPLGTASAVSRPDVAAAFGLQFLLSGFAMQVAGLPAGHYRLDVTALSAVAPAASLTNSVEVDVAGNPQLAIDEPRPNATVDGTFATSGWALDPSSSSGTGVDAVHVWAFPSDGGPARFIAQAAYGESRPDVAALYGARFQNVGWSAFGSGLSSGDWTIVVFVHSSVTGQFVLSQAVAVHVAPHVLLSIDAPVPEAAVAWNTYVAGWALDLASTGVGVDTVHVWALPADGSAPMFLGHSELGWQRADVAAAFGARFLGSGFIVPVTLPPGTFDLSVFAHSSVTGQFEAVRAVRVHVQ